MLSIDKPPARDRCVPDIVMRQAKCMPEATALVDERRSVTFRKLNEEANRVAHYLLQDGIRAGEAVGVAVSRSVDMAVTVLAILKIGACYVPINRNFPAALVHAIMSASKIRRVFASSDYPAGIIAPSALRFFRDIPVESYPETDIDQEVRGGDIAWVLYTSGSTGVPKGVMGTHDNILNRCRQIWETHPYRSGEVAIQNTRLSVIDSIWELWAPLAQGTPVVLLDEQKSCELRYLIDSWQDYGISRICLVPSLLNEILDAFPDLRTRVPKLHQWITSGEMLTARTVRRFYRVLPEAVLYNQYGLTESSADVTTYDTRSLPVHAGDDEIIPVGQMFDGVGAMLIDQKGDPVAAGERGELCLSGPCLLLGYARHQSNHERFFTQVANGAQVRWFRTGDFAYWNPAGDLVITGRTDRQVKIRGYRVECDGVEATLAECQAVSEIVVIARADRAGANVLQAFVVLFPGRSVTEVDLFARMHLPEYMVPSHFEAVAEIPRTHSGKLDRSALAVLRTAVL
jgi:amino acid adenylation domain-containing protein